MLRNLNLGSPTAKYQKSQTKEEWKLQRGNYQRHDKINFVRTEENESPDLKGLLNAQD